jgi:hypothetical protein
MQGSILKKQPSIFPNARQHLIKYKGRFWEKEGRKLGNKKMRVFMSYGQCMADTNILKKSINK